MDNTGISVNLPLPVCGTSGKAIEIKFDTQYTGVEDAAEFVNTLLHRSHTRYHEVKDTEQQQLKRRRTAENLNVERRRARANEAIVFRINGAQSSSQFRIKRSDQFKRSLELFAEQTNVVTLSQYTPEFAYHTTSSSWSESHSDLRSL